MGNRLFTISNYVVDPLNFVSSVWYFACQKGSCRIHTGIVATYAIFFSAQAVLLQDATLLFVSGFLIAIAIESSQLPRRLALRALLIVGSDPKWYKIFINDPKVVKHVLFSLAGF